MTNPEAPTAAMEIIQNAIDDDCLTCEESHAQEALKQIEAMLSHHPINLCMEHLYRELEGNWLAYDNGQEFNVTSEEDCPIENQDCGCHHHFDSDCKG